MRKNTQNRNETAAGHTIYRRKEFRDGGGAIANAAAGIRSCLPDSVWAILKNNLNRGETIDELRTVIPPDGDTTFKAMAEFLYEIGISFKQVTARFSKKGGCALMLFNTTGLFVLQLNIIPDDKSKESELHCIAYDGVWLLDSYIYAKPIKIDDVNRKDKINAKAAIRALFAKTAMVRIEVKNIYEIKSIQ